MGDVICSCCEETWGTVERGTNKTIWQLCPCCEDYNKQLQSELAEAQKCYTTERAENNALEMKVDSLESKFVEAKKRIMFLEGLVRPGELTSTG